MKIMNINQNQCRMYEHVQDDCTYNDYIMTLALLPALVLHLLQVLDTARAIAIEINFLK